MLDNFSKPICVLRASYLEDVPRAFLYSRHGIKGNDSSIFCGPYAKTIWNFANYQKVPLQLDLVDNVSTSEINKRLSSGVNNVALNGGIYSNTNIVYSYPAAYVENCIMVPLEDELPKYYYVIWPFGRFIWLSIFVGAIYVAVLMRYIDHPAPPQRATRSIVRNVLHSVAILLYCSNMNLSLQNANLRVHIFYGLLLLLGFILSAYYFPYLTAYNMKPVFVPPINTVDDLLKANIRVLISKDDLEELHFRNSPNLQRIEPLMRGIPRRDFQTMLDKTDHNYAYFVSTDQWNFIYRQQRNLKQPFFHKSQICLGVVLRAFPMQPHAELNEALNHFVIRILQAGLWWQWEEQAFMSAVSAGYARILLDTYPVEALNLSFFRIAWIVLATGLTASACALLVELYLWRRLNWRQYHQFE